jgi:hypothetical protein
MSKTWECHDGFFGFPDERELEPGRLDDDAVHVFMRGHCHSFAEAVCRLVPTAELVLAYEPVQDGNETVGQSHVLVRLDGRFLDVRGWVDQVDDETMRDVEAFWGRVKPITREGWLAEGGSGWLDLRVDDALPFALALLSTVGVEVDREQRLLAEMLMEVD